MLSNSHKKEFENLFRILDVFNTKLDTVMEKLNAIKENISNGTTVAPEPIVYTVTFTGGTSGVSNCDIYINDTGYDTSEDIVIEIQPDTEITVKFMPHEGYVFEDGFPYIEDVTVPDNTKITKAELIDNIYTAVYMFKDICRLSLSALPVLQPVVVTFTDKNMANTKYTVNYNNNIYDTPDKIDVIPGRTININLITIDNYIFDTGPVICINGTSLLPTIKNDTLASFEYVIDNESSFELYSQTKIKTYTVNFIKDLTCGFMVTAGDKTLDNPDNLQVNHGEDIQIKLITTHNGYFATPPTITYDGNVIDFDVDDINYTKTITITKNADIKIYTDYIFGAYDNVYPDDDFDPNHADTPDFIDIDTHISLKSDNPEYTVELKHFKYLMYSKISCSIPFDIIIKYISNGEQKEYIHNANKGYTYLMPIFNITHVDDNTPLYITFKHKQGIVTTNIDIKLGYTTKLNHDILTKKPNNRDIINNKYYIFSLIDDAYEVTATTYNDIGLTSCKKSYDLQTDNITIISNAYIVLSTTSTNIQYFDVNAYYK